MNSDARLNPGCRLENPSLLMRRAFDWLWQFITTSCRRYSESLVQRALEGISDSRREAWVWSGSGVR